MRLPGGCRANAECLPAPTTPAAAILCHVGSVLILQAAGDAVIDAPGNVALWSFWQARTYYGPLLAVVPF